jgi:hypothetical protein
MHLGDMRFLNRRMPAKPPPCAIAWEPARDLDRTPSGAPLHSFPAGASLLVAPFRFSGVTKSQGIASKLAPTPGDAARVPHREGLDRLYDGPVVPT